MSRESWRLAEIVVVPAVLGMRVRDAQEVAHAAGLTLAQPDPDGPPISALTWSSDFWVTKQTPTPDARAWRWDSIVVEWSKQPDGGAGVRDPGRPCPPDNTLVANLPLPTGESD